LVVELVRNEAALGILVLLNVNAIRLEEKTRVRQVVKLVNLAQVLSKLSVSFSWRLQEEGTTLCVEPYTKNSRVSPCWKP